MITLRRQLELEGIFIIFLVGIVSSFIVLNGNNFFSFGTKPSVSAGSITSPLSVNPRKTPEKTEYSQISPDGTMELFLNVETYNDDTKQYSLYVSEKSDQVRKFVFEKTLELHEDIAIPFNTWSPDNKYFFVQENSDNQIANVLVFKVDGESFSETEKYLEVVNMFGERITDYSFDKATGWGSESLIVFNTKDQFGEKGPSFWFEVPSKAITQLSTEF